jgi:glycosyltransferase involved in cell wall biosynthesis
MNRTTTKDISVIIPLYNTEDYLTQCVDSLKDQNLNLEIIIINDGSTDRSGNIANQLAQQNDNIKVVYQQNQGLSAARNKGLKEASGKYIFFLDSDDWVATHSLKYFYSEALKHNADIIMGNAVYWDEGEFVQQPFNSIGKTIVGISLSGKKCFVELLKTGALAPMACNYICRREYLERFQFQFENVIHEDEIWTPSILAFAQNVVVTNHNLYYYRQRKGSITRSTNTKKRLDSLFLITNRLFELADHFDFLGEDREFKSWLYVNIFRLYSLTFTLLSRQKDSSIILPEHKLDRFLQNSTKMALEPQKVCKDYWQQAKIGLKKYTDWRTSDWVVCAASQNKANNKLMLIYNTMWGEDLDIKIEDVPNDWIITTDRRYFEQANAVVFHLPNLMQEMEQDLDKPEGQIWIAWHLESEVNYPFIKNPEVRELFDLWMSYRPDADIIYPSYEYRYLDLFSQQLATTDKQNKVCILISSPVNESGRIEYLKELMDYTEIDSYGRLFNNKQLPNDRGRETKLTLYQNYKFVIAFENAIDTDYVTEKFFDPLLAGTVPIYLGAPNIEDFVPGENCFVDVRQFENPKRLAEFIKACYEDQSLYDSFFDWKKKSLLPSFVEKAEEQRLHPIVRLCLKVREVLGK